MADIGILTKNYRIHLDKAIESGGTVTFYSNTRWVSAKNALTNGKKVELYFVADGGSGTVEYQGSLSEATIAPVQNTAEAVALLLKAPDDAARQGLQSGVIKTLYSVTNLHKLQPPFSQTKLLKLSDGKCVSEAYDRAYCIVHPYK